MSAMECCVFRHSCRAALTAAMAAHVFLQTVMTSNSWLGQFIIHTFRK